MSVGEIVALTMADLTAMGSEKFRQWHKIATMLLEIRANLPTLKYVSREDDIKRAISAREVLRMRWVERELAIKKDIAGINFRTTDPPSTITSIEPAITRNTKLAEFFNAAKPPSDEDEKELHELVFESTFEDAKSRAAVALSVKLDLFRSWTSVVMSYDNAKVSYGFSAVGVEKNRQRCLDPVIQRLMQVLATRRGKELATVDANIGTMKMGEEIKARAATATQKAIDKLSMLKLIGDECALPTELCSSLAAIVNQRSSTNELPKIVGVYFSEYTYMTKDSLREWLKVRSGANFRNILFVWFVLQAFTT